MFMIQPLMKKRWKIQPLLKLNKDTHINPVRYPKTLDKNSNGSHNNVLNISHNIVTDITNQIKLINIPAIQSNPA